MFYVVVLTWTFATSPWTINNVCVRLETLNSGDMQLVVG